MFVQMEPDGIAGGIDEYLDNQALAVWRRRGGEWLLCGYQPTIKP